MVYMPSHLFTEEVLAVLYALSPNLNTYHDLQTSLLKRFKLTEQGFQKRFRTLVPQSGQDFDSFLNQFAKLLGRWLEAAEIKTKTATSQS
ncbi:hypothetical protein PoB_004285700 [Plakobranchus ocellatus]|uniref:SCAN box domain-containing protein n=1 Tax=Plakobranchus ocellatus TaxID=259542 RepID=A0AAV4BB23_9GAST|nr:hypothetical protein PoB_004285700 [Plakobranchus ocellatus]